MLLLSTISLSAVHYETSVTGILDNREYGNGPSPDQTYFFVSTQNQIGISVAPDHFIKSGFTFLQEFGAPATVENLHLLLYYEYAKTDFQFLMGSIPRQGILTLPKELLNDSTHYFRPFLQGAFCSLNKGPLTAHAWVDWTGRQTDTVPEAFLFGIGSTFSRGVFFANQDFVMYHKAAPGNRINYHAVQDNGGLSVSAGIATGKTVLLDTLCFSAGGVMSLDRSRVDNIWHTPAGGVLNGEIWKGHFGMKVSAFKGQSQILSWGDSFFTLPSFARADFMIHFIKSENVKANFFQSFHFFDRKIGYSQHFLLAAALNGSVKK